MSIGVSGKHSALGANIGTFGGGGAGGGGGLQMDHAQQYWPIMPDNLEMQVSSQEGAYYINLPSVGVTQIYCAPWMVLLVVVG